MLDLRVPQNREPARQRGNVLFRGFNQFVKALIPLDIDPTDKLLAPGDTGLHTVRPIEIPLDQGHTFGYLLTPKNPHGGTICFVHGTAAEKVLPYFFFLRAYLAAGFQILFFELDGHGRNPRPLRYPDIVGNVPAAWHFLRQQPEVDPQRLGIVGVSLGGACVLRTAAELPGLKAAVTVSTPHTIDIDAIGKIREALGTFNLECLPVCLEATPNRLLEFVTTPMRIGLENDGKWDHMDLLDDRTQPAVGKVIAQLDPLHYAANLGTLPLLVVGGLWDQQAPARQAKELYAAATGPKGLALVPGRNHFTLMASTKAIDATVDWFCRWL